MANLALAGGLEAGDVDHPLHLINGRPPEGPFQLDVRRGERVRLRFINAATDTIYAVFVEGHELRVTHADGLPVEPVATDALLVGMAERFNALIEPRGEGGARVIAIPLGKQGRAVATMRLAAGSRARTPPADAPVRPPRRLLTCGWRSSSAPWPSVVTLRARTWTSSWSWPILRPSGWPS
jgi:FtsP/CotA-like multicopper oxidase with cupredoxin domain